MMFSWCYVLSLNHHTWHVPGMEAVPLTTLKLNAVSKWQCGPDTTGLIFYRSYHCWKGGQSQLILTIPLITVMWTLQLCAVRKQIIVKARVHQQISATFLSLANISGSASRPIGMTHCNSGQHKGCHRQHLERLSTKQCLCTIRIEALQIKKKHLIRYVFTKH